MGKNTNIKGTQSSSFGTNGRSNHDSSKFYNSKLYKELKNDIPVRKDSNFFPQDLLNSTILDSAEDMAMIPSNSLHLMITSPPYNVSKEYDKDLSLSEYLEMLRKVFTETYRVLVNGGRACINLANLGRKPYIPLTDYISQMMLEIGYNMRGEIIWNKAASASPSTAWGSWMSASNPILRDIHEYILIFSKGDYKRERTKIEKETKRDTISRDEFMEWTKSIWTFNAESARRVGHPAPFPIDLPHRLIQLYSFTTDIVLDPFMGSGTTAIASLKNNRNYIGFEISQEYINLIKQRTAPFENMLQLEIK